MMKTQTYFRKILAIVMTLIMSFSALPFLAYAAAHEQSSFVDVNRNDWFFEQVQFLVERGLMTGTTTETFSPDMNVTRAMAVQVFYNYEGRPDVSREANLFEDVADDAWYRDAVVWARNRGIINGFGDGTFRPDDYITRAHLTLLFNNYVDFSGIELPPQRGSIVFADYADIRNYAKEAIDRFFRAMIINGRPDGRFDPQGNATRAELAAMLSNFVIFSENAANLYGDYNYAQPEYGFICDEPIVTPAYGIELPPFPPYGFGPGGERI